MGKNKNRIENWAGYYDHSDILDELLEEPVHFSLDPEIGDHQIPALPDLDSPQGILLNEAVDRARKFQRRSFGERIFQVNSADLIRQARRWEPRIERIAVIDLSLAVMWAVPEDYSARAHLLAETWSLPYNSGSRLFMTLITSPWL
jgi:hypothetical protein